MVATGKMPLRGPMERITGCTGRERIGAWRGTPPGAAEFPRPFRPSTSRRVPASLQPMILLWKDQCRELFAAFYPPEAGTSSSLKHAMRAEVHAGSTVNAFDGLLLLVQGYRAHQAGLLAAAATDAAILVKDHTAVWPLLHGARGAGFGTGWVLTGPADHHAKIALNAALRLDLDGAVLQGYRTGTNPAASEHAAQAADAALGMGHLEAAACLWLCSNLPLTSSLGAEASTSISSLASWVSCILIRSSEKHYDHLTYLNINALFLEEKSYCF